MQKNCFVFGFWSVSATNKLLLVSSLRLKAAILTMCIYIMDINWLLRDFFSLGLGFVWWIFGKYNLKCISLWMWWKKDYCPHERCCVRSLQHHTVKMNYCDYNFASFLWKFRMDLLTVWVKITCWTKTIWINALKRIDSIRCIDHKRYHPINR